jgi:hypothetical protein
MEQQAIGRWEWEGGTTAAGHARSSVRRERDVGFGCPAARAVSETAHKAGQSPGNTLQAQVGTRSFGATDSPKVTM